MPAAAIRKIRQRDLHALPVHIHADTDNIVHLQSLVVSCVDNIESLRLLCDQRIPWRSRVNRDIREAAPGRAKIPAHAFMLFAECYDISRKLQHGAVPVTIIPVQPADLIVLAVTIVVAELRVREFIPCREHRRTTAHHQNRHCIFHHADPERFDLRIQARSLTPAIPAAVIIRTVRIVPAIHLVVLLIVGIQIVQREPVMTGQEIHGRVVSEIAVRTAALLRGFFRIQIGGPDHAPRRLRRHPVIPLQK